MTFPSLIFLILCIGAFAFFGVVLFSAYIWANLPAKPAAEDKRDEAKGQSGFGQASGAAR
jgi:hypothetical protein